MALRAHARSVVGASNRDPVAANVWSTLSSAPGMTRPVTPDDDRADLPSRHSGSAGAVAPRVLPARRPRYGSRERTTGIAFAGFVVVLLVVSGVGGGRIGAPSTGAALATGPGASSLGNFSKIQHVVILMMENRAYDNYLGEYCLQVGPYCPMAANGIPAGTCVPLYPTNASSPCAVPYNMTAANWSGQGDLPHTWKSSHQALNNGSMNNFYLAETRLNYTFGHFNGSTIPTYWDMAEESGISDNFFSSTLTYSLPNHWFLVAAQAPPVIMGSTINNGNNITAAHDYLDQANVTPAIEQELLANPSVSWNYYDYALENYSHAIHDLSSDDPSAYGTWNPMAAKNQSYVGSVPSHFKWQSSFFTDVQNRSLPNISWVIPNAKYSDHLPANVTYGEDFVASVVNAVAASPYWQNTAVFVTWDEYGGWYDHVAPPQIDANGLGFRVPIFVFSPWTQPGYVDHSTLYFESLLHFVEWRWNLGCLLPRDCTAPLPTGFFNFNYTHAPSFFAPANDSVYPYEPPTGPPYIISPSQLAVIAASIGPTLPPEFDWN